MKVQVEEISTIERRLSIEVDKAVVEQELAEAYRALSRQVKLPGFRPGKIPRRILEQKFKSDVEADVVKRVQLRAFFDALQETKMPAVGDPHMSGGTIAPNQPFAFTARVEVKPNLVVKDYKGLVLAKFDAAVSDDKVEEQLTRLRESRTTFEPVVGRDTVQRGDFAIIDFEAACEGKPFPGSVGRDVTVEVVDGSLTQGNLPQLEGATLSSTTEFDHSFPADSRVEEVRGKTAQFRATVKAIKDKRVPPLDDAFAVGLGLASLAELKSRVRRDLERAAAKRAEVDAREDALKKLIEKNTFEVPTSMVERGVDVMLESALGNMARSGLDPRTLDLDWGRLRADLRPRSEIEVRGQLLLEAIAVHEKLAVTDQDLERKLEEMAAESTASLPALRKQFADPGRREALRSRVLEDRALALVKSHAKAD